MRTGGQGRSTPSSSSPSPTYVSTELSSNRYWRNGQKPEYSERLSQRLEFFCGSLRRTAEQWTRMRNLVNWRSWFSKTERCCRLTCCNAMRSEREGEEKRRKEREREREFRHKCCVTSKNTIFLIGFKPRPLIHHWLRACTWTCVMLSKSHELNI